MEQIEKDLGIISKAAKLNDEADSFIKDELTKAGIRDLLPCHGDILYACFKSPGIRITQIASLTHRSKSTVSAMVDKLKKLGYLEKTADKDDPRAICIHPTQKALSIADTFRDISTRLNEKLGQKLSYEEMEKLSALLLKAIGSFREN